MRWSRPRQLKQQLVLQPPAGWSPQSTIATYFPAMAELCRAIQPALQPIEARLDRDEALGRDTSCLRQALRELRWRLEYTGDAAGVRTTFARIRSLAALPAAPSAALPGQDGRYGTGTEVWFLQLDASVDHLLAPDFAGTPPRFLDRINDPDAAEALPRGASRFPPGGRRRRPSQGAQLRDRRSRPIDFVAAAGELPLGSAARSCHPPLCRELAGPGHRVLRCNLSRSPGSVFGRPTSASLFTWPATSMVGSGIGRS